MQPDAFVLEQAPGYLIRRAHQISVAVFAEHTVCFDATPMQFAVLSVLSDAPGATTINPADRGLLLLRAQRLGPVVKSWQVILPQMALLSDLSDRMWIPSIGPGGCNSSFVGQAHNTHTHCNFFCR